MTQRDLNQRQSGLNTGQRLAKELLALNGCSKLVSLVVLGSLSPISLMGTCLGLAV